MILYNIRLFRLHKTFLIVFWQLFTYLITELRHVQTFVMYTILTFAINSIIRTKDSYIQIYNSNSILACSVSEPR